MRWIVIRDKGLAVSVECPKCHNRFTIVKRKDWKCCPICGTKMSGYTDRKTEPQTCEECKHWSDTEDGCADRHGCRATTEDCSTVPTSSKMEQVQPQTCSVNGRPYDCGNCEYHKCTADEPQTELVNDSPILAKDLVDDEFNPYDEECMRCKHLKLQCEFVPSYCKYEPRDVPQTERSK